MKKRSFWLLALVAILALVAAACGDDSDGDGGSSPDPAPATDDEAGGDDGAADGGAEMADIVDTAVGSGEFPTLVAALQAADLVDTLKGEGPFTVFAPTEDAFAAALDALGLTAEELLASDDLASILTYHVVPGKVLAETVVTLDGSDVETVNGATVAISVDGDSVMVNDATVVETDIEGSNGVIHVIDTVLLPPAGDDAGDDAADDGGAEMADIVDTAVGSGEFPTLVAALEAADLVGTLKGEGPFTVFAPTEEAFAAALDALGLTAEELLASDDLASILTYHVVPGKVLAETVVTLDGTDVETVNGATVAISVDGDSVMVNDATVVETDIEGSNGVIHVIDTVLLPPQ